MISNLSVSQLLESVCAINPTKEASYDGYQRISYYQLWQESINLAAALNAIGVKKGDKVAVCLPNSNEFVVIYMAVAHLGAILVPFNTRYRLDEVHYILKNSEAKVAFLTNGFSGVNHYEQFMAAKESIASLETLITVRCEIDGLLSYQQMVEKQDSEEFTPAQINPDHDVFSILYTSGSTGSPKGAMLTHANVVRTALKSCEKMNCTGDDVFLVAVPAFHVFGMVPSILSSIAVGARMVLMEEYKPKTALEIIESEQITIKNGVPTMFILELNYYDFARYDLSSLRTGIIAAAPCPVEIVKRIRSEMGCDIVVAYGLSETSPNLTMTSFEDEDIN